MFVVGEVIETKQAYKSQQKDDDGTPLFNGSVLVRLNGNKSLFDNVKAKWCAPAMFNKRIPLIGEMVVVFAAPHVEYAATEVKRESYYYFSIVNSINDVTTHQFPRKYQRATNNKKDIPPEILADKEESGYTIKGCPTSMKMLQPFEGDDLWEGRYGQSIRFTRQYEQVNSPGPGIYEKKADSYWKGSKADDPLMILKVRKPDGSTGYSYDIEDLSKDNSSIYLTTTQKLLKLDGGFTKNSTVRQLSTWQNGSQIVLDSDRIVLNAKSDRAMLIGKEQVIVTGKKVLLQSNKYSVDLDDLMDWLEMAYAEVWKLSSAQAVFTTAMGPTAVSSNTAVITKIHKADWAKFFKTPA